MNIYLYLLLQNEMTMVFYPFQAFLLLFHPLARALLVSNNNILFLVIDYNHFSFIFFSSVSFCFSVDFSSSLLVALVESALFLLWFAASASRRFVS